MAEPTQTIVDQQLAAALTSPALRLYVNGFMLGQSLSDIAVVTQTNGATVAIINMSYTTAKTLAKDLGELLARFEEATKHEIMTMHDVQARGGGTPVQNT